MMKMPPLLRQTRMHETGEKIKGGVNDFICRFTADFRITFANRAFCDFFCPGSETLKGTSFIDIFRPDERDAMIHRLHSLTCENSVVIHQQRSELPDSSMVWLEWIHLAVFDDDGNITSYQSVARDITPGKRMEELIETQHEISAILSENINIKDSMKTVLESIMNIHPIDSGGIYFLDNNKDSLILTHYRNLSENMIGCVRSREAEMGWFDEPVGCETPIQGRTRLTDNLSGEEGMRSMGIIPVFHRRELLAAILVGSSKVPAFPPSLRSMVESIAEWLGPVIAEKNYQDRIFENQKNLLTLFDTIEDMLFILDVEGNIIFINEAVTEIMGYSYDETLGSNITMFHPPEKKDRSHSVTDDTNGDTDPSYHNYLRTKDGRDVPVETRVVLGEWSGKDVLIALTRDITPRIMLEQKVRESSERFELAIRGGNLGTWDWNIRTGTVLFNDRWAEMLGYSPNEIEPNVKTWEKLLHPDDLNLVINTLNDHLEGRTALYQTEHRLKTKWGDWLWVLDTGKVFQHDEHGNAIRAVGTHQDITVLKEVQERLEELAITDPLTGIFNRRYIFQRLDRLIEKQERLGTDLCVAILDLDYFKNLNDSHGHLAGDYILMEFSRLMKSHLRPYDLLGRYGGEEFIIIFDEIAVANAGKMLERIRDSVGSGFFSFNNREISFTFSGGLASIKRLHGIDISSETLINHADELLYRAKRTGRNRIASD